MGKTATATVTITNRLGLHARPAMMFVEVASEYQCDIQVCRADGGGDCPPVDGKSIMQMMMLAATCGTELVLTATGDDAEEALLGLSELIASKFEEE